MLNCVAQGPTITMKIHQYSLMKDVTAVQNRPHMADTLWQVLFLLPCYTHTLSCFMAPMPNAQCSIAWCQAGLLGLLPMFMLVACS